MWSKIIDFITKSSNWNSQDTWMLKTKGNK